MKFDWIFKNKNNKKIIEKINKNFNNYDFFYKITWET